MHEAEIVSIAQNLRYIAAGSNALIRAISITRYLSALCNMPSVRFYPILERRGDEPGRDVTVYRLPTRFIFDGESIHFRVYS